MDYTVAYVLFSGLFLGAIAGYWLVTRPLRDPEALYVTGAGRSP